MLKQKRPSKILAEKSRETKGLTGLKRPYSGTNLYLFQTLCGTVFWHPKMVYWAFLKLPTDLGNEKITNELLKALELDC